MLMSRRRLLASFLVGAAVLWGMLLAPLNQPRLTLSAAGQRRPFGPMLFFSPDSSQLVTVHHQQNKPSPVGGEPPSGNRGSAKLWDVGSGQLMARLTDNERFITSVAFSPDGTALAGRQEDGRISVWDRGTGKLIGEHAHAWLLKDAHPQTQVVYAPDGRLLYQNGEIWTRMHDVATGKLESDFTEKKAPFDSASVGIQNFFLAAGPPGAVVFRLDTGEVHAVFETDGVKIDGNDVLSQNGRCYAFLRRDGSDGTTLMVWTPSGRRMLRRDFQLAGALSNDGRWLATFIIRDPVWPIGTQPNGTKNGVVVITDTSTGRERALLPGTPSVAFAPDDRTLAISLESGDVQLWDFPLRTRWEWIIPAGVATAALAYWVSGLRRRPVSRAA
jgi:WD40 repeat protein